LARLGVRGTFSQPGPSRPAAAVRLARTLGVIPAHRVTRLYQYNYPPSTSVKRKNQGRKLSDFFFTYSWQEIGSVRQLRNTWVGTYLCVGAFGYIFAPFGSSEGSALILGALACYPAYLLGLRSQRTANPLALEREELMVWRMGLLAKVFACAGIVFLTRHILRS
jgi:hypothetical protein